MRKLLVLALVVACGPDAHRRPAVSSPETFGTRVTERAAVLPAALAAEVVHARCGEGQPWAVTGYWTPSADLVRSVEPGLDSVLADALGRVAKARGDSAGDVLRDARLYRRQYVGFRRGTTRLVFVRGFRLYEHSDTADLSWLRYPQSTCDGGAGYFGLVYNPSKRQFGRVEFNQSFEGRVRY